MMKIFDCFVRVRPQLCLGEVRTGSCGYVLSHRLQFLISDFRQLLIIINLIVPANVYHMGTALNSTAIWSVLVVHLNMHVFSVNVTIVQASVLFVPKARLQAKPPNPRDNHLPTPINVDRLVLFLQGYNVLLVQFLVSGFSEGFPLHYMGTRKSFISKNLVSALNNPLAVDAKISKELAASRLAGPYVSAPFKEFRVSPLGIVPKKTPGEFRLIHHLSYPQGVSVNDGIAEEHSSVSYSTIDDAIKLIKQLIRSRVSFSKNRYPECFSPITNSSKRLSIVRNSVEGFLLL